MLLPYYYTCSVQHPRGLEKVTTSIPKLYMYLLYDTYQQRLKKSAGDLVRGEGSRYIQVQVGCKISVVAVLRSYPTDVCMLGDKKSEVLENTRYLMSETMMRN